MTGQLKYNYFSMTTSKNKCALTVSFIDSFFDYFNVDKICYQHIMSI